MLIWIFSKTLSLRFVLQWQRKYHRVEKLISQNPALKNLQVQKFFVTEYSCKTVGWQVLRSFKLINKQKRIKVTEEQREYLEECILGDVTFRKHDVFVLRGLHLFTAVTDLRSDIYSDITQRMNVCSAPWQRYEQRHIGSDTWDDKQEQFISLTSLTTCLFSHSKRLA